MDAVDEALLSPDEAHFADKNKRMEFSGGTRDNDWIVILVYSHSVSIVSSNLPGVTQVQFMLKNRMIKYRLDLT